MSVYFQLVLWIIYNAFQTGMSSYFQLVLWIIDNRNAGESNLSKLDGKGSHKMQEGRDSVAGSTTKGQSSHFMNDSKSIKKY